MDRTDMFHAREPRALAQPLLAPAPLGGAAETDRLVGQGDCSMDARDYAQAADLYRRALALRPGAPAILDRLGRAFIHNRLFAELEHVVDWLFATGGSFSVGVAHGHSADYCLGTLILSPMRVSYQPASGDHAFSSRTIDLVSVRDTQIGALPAIEIHTRESGGGERRHHFVLRAYLTCDPAVRRLDGGLFGDAQALLDTGKAGRVLVRALDRR